MTARPVPCAVVAALGGPVSLTRPVHLDALLLAARFRVEGPASFGAPFPALAHEGGIPRASASFLVAAGLGGTFETHETQTRRLEAKRGDFDHLDAASGRTSIGSDSPFRNQLPRSARVVGVGYLVWHAVVDPDLARALLAEIACVGGSSAAGVGRVTSWEVEEADLDPMDAGWFLDGRPIRRLPVDVVTRRLGAVPDGLDRRTMRPVAPYHATDEAVECVEPRLGEMTRRRSRMSALTW